MRHQHFVRKHLVRAPNGLYQQRPKSHPVVVKRVHVQTPQIRAPHVVHVQGASPVAPAASPVAPAGSATVPLETVPSVLAESSVSPPPLPQISTHVTTAAPRSSSQQQSSQTASNHLGSSQSVLKQPVLENLVPANETPEQKEARLKALRLKCVVPDVEEFMNSKTAQCFEGLEFKFPFITCNTEFSAACLWCKQYFSVPVSALNCKIFRHAYYRIGSSEWQLGDLVNPHASKDTIESLKKQNKILGCGGAMYYDGTILRAVGFNT